jgi:hypothetical protein
VAKPPAGPAPNLLDLKPVRLVGDERSPEDRAVLLRPKFVWKPAARLFQGRLRHPFYKVLLDDIGTFVWDRLDGDTTVGEIADAARDHFGERIEPVYERLRLFLQELETGKFIRIPR